MTALFFFYSLFQGFQGKTGPPGPPGVVGPQVSHGPRTIFLFRVSYNIIS